MSLTKNVLRSKIGTSIIFDEENQVRIDLPGGLKVFNRTAQIWIGGDISGDVLLVIERLSPYEKALPTVLAQGDLDLYLCSTGTIATEGVKIEGLAVAGSFGGKEIKGYLAAVELEPDSAYLILLARKGPESIMGLKEVVLEIATQIECSNKAI